MLRNIKKKTNDDTARINGLNPVFCSGAVPLHSTHSQENEIQPRFSTPKTDGFNSVFCSERHSLATFLTANKNASENYSEAFTAFLYLHVED